MKKIPVAISARHVHLSEKDFHLLFGKTAKLHIDRMLSQKGEFAAREMVNVWNGKRVLKKVRIVGPLRPYTQVELAATDARMIGVEAPIARSGHLEGAARVTIATTKKRIVRRAAIMQRRHIHLHPKEAAQLKLKDGSRVAVQITGERAAVLKNVEIKVHERFSATLHLDTDEGNAVGVAKNTRAELVL